MLRCVQRSSLEKFASGIGTDMSVLERQRFMLQRLYQQYQQQEQQNLHSSQTTMPLFQYQNLMNSLKLNHSVEENSLKFGFACSEITTNTSLDMDHHQRPFSAISANSSKDHQIAPTKKRKAEFDVEEDCKEKRLEGEAGEVQSGITVKSEKENSGGRNSRENSKVSEVVQKTDYIHVRARRGQATDSHSLAERARREKISKKMKCLQDLVPGCNKVTGKAGMLDEIINYVQSLQKQVEFLSMKLAALNPRLDFNIDNFFAKEFPAYIASFPTAGSPKEVVHSALVQYNQGQQESTCSGVDTAINPNQMVPQRAGTTSSVSFPEAFLDSVPSLSHNQQMSTWDSDWQSLYNVSFH